MAVVYNAAVKNARMQIVLNAMDAAATPAHLRIYTAGLVQLLDFALLKPSFLLVGDTLQMLGVPRGAFGLNVGDANVGRIYDGNGVLVVDQLSVAQNAANIIIASTSISVGQPNQLLTGVLVHG